MSNTFVTIFVHLC